MVNILILKDTCRVCRKEVSKGKGTRIGSHTLVVTGSTQEGGSGKVRDGEG